MSKPKLSALSNPLATVEQLRSSASILDGIPVELERTLRLQGSLLTQAAGILLHLDQAIIAQAIVLFTRFFTGPEGGSFRLHAVQDLSAAALYLTAKLSTDPQPTRALLNVYAYLESAASPFTTPDRQPLAARPTDPGTYTLASQSAYLARQKQLFADEALILRQLGYSTRVVLPHPLALTYIQTLFPPGSTVEPARKTALARRTIAVLNTALLSPQLLYVTHQPHALAVAAIYLAARETGLRISNGEWWLVWDVTREELGFLVLAFHSVEPWVQAEYASPNRPLLSVAAVEAELQAAAATATAADRVHGAPA